MVNPAPKSLNLPGGVIEGPQHFYAVRVYYEDTDLSGIAYHANYLIDNKLGVIVDAEGTRSNRIEENRVAVAMVARVKERFDLKPKRLAADTAYGSAKTLKALMDHGIEPHIPVGTRASVPMEPIRAPPSAMIRTVTFIPAPAASFCKPRARFMTAKH